MLPRNNEIGMHANQQARKILLSLLMTAASAALAQFNGDPLSLQNSGIGRIDQFVEQVRRTGDANSTAYELEGAQAELKASFDIFMQRRDYAGAALSATKMATIQRLRNHFAQAAQLYQKANDLAKSAGRTDYQTAALADLAFSDLQLGDTDAAEQNAREAVRIGAKCDNKKFYFDALDRAGEIEVKRGDLAAANEDLNRALALTNELNDKKRVFVAYMDRADIYSEIARKCDYQRNFNVCYQSLELARADYRSAAAITQELGYAYFTQLIQGFIKEMDVRKSLIKSKEHSDETVGKANFFNPQKPTDVLVSEFFTYGAMDNSTVAPLQAAVADMQMWRTGLRRQGLNVPDLGPDDLCMQAQLAEMKGDNDTALNAFEKAQGLLEKDRRKLNDQQARGAFLEDKLACYYRPALILISRKQYAEAFTIFESSRSRTMADLLASQPLKFGSSKERELFSELQILKASIAAQQEKVFNLTSSTSRDKSTDVILNLENKIAVQQQRYEQVQNAVAQQAPKLMELTSVQPAFLSDVQQSAAKGGYDVLYYVVMEHALIVWHIDGSSVQVRNVFLPHGELIGKVKTLRTSLVAPSDGSDAPFDEVTSRQLFLYLIQPMVPFIRSRHLILIPHEELNAIPFQALLDPSSGKFLGETFAISYAPSATVLQNLEDKSSLNRGRLLALADPEIHEASNEVVAIGKLYPGRSKVVAQKATNKAEVESWVNNYDLVHLSVHGSFNSSDPMLSYLQFKGDGPDNGRLTAAEMFGLPLRKNSLVVLSACETGRVEATHSNEVLGMVRSLLYAGASRLVLSSWEVNAGSTRLWMETFYKNGQNSSPAEAARQALIAVRARPEYIHPFFWAPFVMMGK